MGILPMMRFGHGQDAHATTPMPEPKPIPVNYASPRARSRPPLTSIGLTLYLGFITLAVLIFGWFILPRLEVAFADFDADLPLVTVAMLGLTRWLTGFPGMIVLLATPALAPVLLNRFIQGGHTPQAHRVRALIAYLLVSFLAAGLVIWIVLAVVLPWFGLIQSLAAPRGG